MRDKGVLDSAFMDSGSPLYETLRKHYLFSGLDQDDFDTLVAGVSPKALKKAKCSFIAAIPRTASIFSTAD